METNAYGITFIRINLLWYWCSSLYPTTNQSQSECCCTSRISWLYIFCIPGVLYFKRTYFFNPCFWIRFDCHWGDISSLEKINSRQNKLTLKSHQSVIKISPLKARIVANVTTKYDSQVRNYIQLIII